jgi:hypothetical protein
MGPHLKSLEHPITSEYIDIRGLNHENQIVNVKNPYYDQ